MFIKVHGQQLTNVTLFYHHTLYQEKT